MNRKKKFFWHHYGLYITVCAAALIIILTVVLIVVHGRRTGKSLETDEAIADGIIVNNAEESYTYDFSVIGLKKDLYPEINELAGKYLEALRLGDVEELNKIIQSDTKINEGSVSATGEYVESYQNISCYTMEGLDQDTYVVYVVYEEKLKGIDTPVPSMIRLYVCRDASGQGVYIYNGALTGEMKTYMEIADSDEDVSILKSQVNQAFLNACQEDAGLAEVYSRLQQSMDGTSGKSGTESAGASAEASVQTSKPSSEAEEEPVALSESETVSE